MPLVGLGKVTDLHLGFGPHDFRKILRITRSLILSGYAVICLPFVPVRVEFGYSTHVSTFCFDISAY